MIFNSISRSLYPSLILLQERVLLHITRKQKIICAIALVAFASLLLCYTKFCNVLKPVKLEDPKKEEAKEEEKIEIKLAGWDEQGMKDSIEEITRKWKEENLGKNIFSWSPAVIKKTDEKKLFLQMIKHMKEERLKKDPLQEFWRRQQERNEAWEDMMNHFSKPPKPPGGFSVIYVNPKIPEGYLQRLWQAYLNFNIPLEPPLRLEAPPERLLLEAGNP